MSSAQAATAEPNTTIVVLVIAFLLGGHGFWAGVGPHQFVQLVSRHHRKLPKGALGETTPRPAPRGRPRQDSSDARPLRSAAAHVQWENGLQCNAPLQSGCDAPRRYHPIANTAARQPQEIAGDVWTIPAERTKPKREHRVPLGSRCLEILRRARGDYIFPGQSRGKPLSNMVFLMALRRNESPVQGHGPLALLQRQRLLKTGYSTLTMTRLLMASKIITPVVPKQVGRSLTSSPERACWKRARKPTMFCLRAQFTPTV